MNGPLLPNGFAIHPPLGTRVTSKSRISRDRNRYPAEMRQYAIAMFNDVGIPTLEAAYLLPPRQYVHPMVDTVSITT